MLIQQLVNGLTLGAVYTLIALSFSLVMGILGVLNLAIAELFMLGGYFGFAVIMAQLPLPVALVAGMAGAALVAAIVERIGYQPFRAAPVVTPMLSTLGFSIILQNVATNIWGSDPLQLTDEVLSGRFNIGPVSVSAIQLTVLGVTVLLVALLAFLVQTNLDRPRAARRCREPRRRAPARRARGPRHADRVHAVRLARGRGRRSHRRALRGDHALYRRRDRAEGDRGDGGRRHHADLGRADRRSPDGRRRSDDRLPMVARRSATSWSMAL